MSETNKSEAELLDQPLADETVFGKWGARLRNFCGTLSVMSVCVVSLVYVWTIHEAIARGSVWPNNTALAIMTLGPVITSWSFMNVNRTLSLIVGNQRTLKEKAIAVKEAISDERK